MRSLPSPSRLLLLAVLPVCLTGCGVDQVVDRTEPTRFLTSTGTKISEKSDRLPFEHAWKNPSVDLSKYKNIVVRPVTTAYLRTEKWEESKSAAIPTKRAYQKRCQALASYWTKSLNKAFSSPVCTYYKTTNANQPDTLVLEVALTEVRFPRTDTPANGSAVPVSNAINPTSGTPVCAFESRTRDGASGKLISTASDRRGPDINLGEPKSADLSAGNKGICDEWSQQLMQRSNTELFPKVRRRWFNIF